ncbi:MAG TPA: YkvA family protein [bacterium]|nr:YkvA family protein [bacterium]
MMQISHLLTLMDEAELSPEALAERLGVSNMSVRRWMKQPAKKAIPAIYGKATEDCVYQLMIEGRLEATSGSAQWAIQQSRNLPFHASLSRLGFSADLKTVVPGQDDRFMTVLSQIGSNTAHRAEVDASKKQIGGFKRLGARWSGLIGTLQAALRSKRVRPVDKLVAYGALFYLVCPFDLIPDSIPVFGLMDDYAVLSLAAAYLLEKYVGVLKAGAKLRS